MENQTQNVVTDNETADTMLSAEVKPADIPTCPKGYRWDPDSKKCILDVG